MFLNLRARVLCAAGAFASAAVLGGCGGSDQNLPSTTTAAATTTTVTGPEGLPVQTAAALAPVSTTVSGAPINGIQCSSLEQLAHQAEAHLKVYVFGHPRGIPATIGMLQPQPNPSDTGTVYNATECYYWLHTDAADGVIQADAPTGRTFTLGDFFSIWGQPLGRRVIAGYRGNVTAIVNGRRWRASPRSIPLHPETSIQLAVGRPVPRFHRVDWSSVSDQPVIGG